MPIPLLAVLSIVAFVSAMSIRIMDPMLPAIAREFAQSPDTVAYLATAFALPYALGQLPIGALGDALGKARIIKFCLTGLTISLAISAFSTSYEMLFATRVFGGLTSGGTIPLCFAIVGDRFPPARRQVALSRVLMAMLSSALFGSVGSGLIASAYGWRAVFVASALLSALALAMAVFALPTRTTEQRPAFSISAAIAKYASVFENKLWVVCFLGVCIEGMVVFGLMPYVAAMLEARGMGGVREAGFVVAGLGTGGFVYTLTVPWLLKWLGQTGMIRLGGWIALAGYIAVSFAWSWPLQMLAFGAAGLGFYMVHNSLQLLATEIAPQARASATALLAFFFFMGHATGPAFYRFAFDHLGVQPAILIAGTVMLALSMWLAAKLSNRAIAAA
jgi:predicted MFS family arabinose efflux permease